MTKWEAGKSESCESIAERRVDQKNKLKNITHGSKVGSML